MRGKQNYCKWDRHTTASKLTENYVWEFITGYEETRADKDKLLLP